MFNDKKDIYKFKNDFIEKILMFKMFVCIFSSLLDLEYNFNFCECINILI